ncbi:MarR family winged helix-turn-helix transcriptional regulator [uncultured Amnibacterium sp.]|uniref:MarR family winged helix-turn-helix transcriptional regulator n=1 Tax=uncultured Amnibacterium sp. TaxID=1631851 RepID=UPI0035CA1BFD
MDVPIDLEPGPARPLLVAIDELDRAERRLRLRVRTEMHLNNTDFTALLYVDRRERRGAPARVGELTDYLAISTAAATTIVNRLSGAGYVERFADPGDGRGRTIRTTDSSRALIDDRFGGIRAELDDLVAGVDDVEEERLLALLHRVRDIISPLH